MYWPELEELFVLVLAAKNLGNRIQIAAAAAADNHHQHWKTAAQRLAVDAVGVASAASAAAAASAVVAAASAVAAAASAVAAASADPGASAVVVASAVVDRHCHPSLVCVVVVVEAVVEAVAVPYFQRQRLSHQLQSGVTT